MTQSKSDRWAAVGGNLAIAIFAGIAATACLLASTKDGIFSENDFLIIGLTYFIAISYVISAIYDYYKYRTTKELVEVAT